MQSKGSSAIFKLEKEGGVKPSAVFCIRNGGLLNSIVCMLTSIAAYPANNVVKKKKKEHVSESAKFSAALFTRTGQKKG